MQSAECRVQSLVYMSCSVAPRLASVCPVYMPQPMPKQAHALLWCSLSATCVTRVHAPTHAIHRYMPCSGARRLASMCHGAHATLCCPMPHCAAPCRRTVLPHATLCYPVPHCAAPATLRCPMPHCAACGHTCGSTALPHATILCCPMPHCAALFHTLCWPMPSHCAATCHTVLPHAATLCCPMLPHCAAIC